MSTSLSDIAKKLNLSISTISRVANNKGNVKPETEALVKAALEKYNYIPNQIARSLKNKSTNTIGVIVGDISDIYFAHVIKGLENAINKNGYTMFLCDSQESYKKEELYLNLMFEKQIDGIVLSTVSKEEEIFDRILSNGLPLVFIDNLPYLNSTYDSVTLDNQKASYIAATHLVEFSHTKIGIITGKLDETTGYERQIGYRKALESHKLDINENIIKVGNFKEDSGYIKMKELLNSNEKITAVIVTSSKMTYGAIKAILDSGLEIPKDISIVGFDIYDESGLMQPKITTIAQPEKEIGEIAGNLIIERIKNPDRSFKQRIVTEPKLIIKNSTDYFRAE